MQAIQSTFLPELDHWLEIGKPVTLGFMEVVVRAYFGAYGKRMSANKIATCYEILSTNTLPGYDMLKPGLVMRAVDIVTLQQRTPHIDGDPFLYQYDIKARDGKKLSVHKGYRYRLVDSQGFRSFLPLPEANIVAGPINESVVIGVNSAGPNRELWVEHALTFQEIGKVLGEGLQWKVQLAYAGVVTEQPLTEQADSVLKSVLALSTNN